MTNKTLFILAFANDPATATYVSYELGNYFQPLMTPGDWAMPLPGWSLSDFTTQCYNDDNVLGALIVYDIENDSGTFNFLVVQNSYTHLYARAMLVECAHNKPPGQILETRVKTITTYDPPALPDPSVSRPKTEPTSKLTMKVIGTVRTSGDGRPDKIARSYAETRSLPSTPAMDAATPPPVSTVQTQSVLPQMSVVWQNTTSIDADGHQGSVPFLTLAALGAYLASRSNSYTTTHTTVVPFTPSGAGSQTFTETTQGNNSTLPYGLALVGTTVGQLGNINFGGQNQTHILKSAASRLASLVGKQWFDACVSDKQQRLDRLCDVTRAFIDYNKVGTIPLRLPEYRPASNTSTPAPSSVPAATRAPQLPNQ